MDLLSPDFLLRIFLVFARIGALFVTAPGFGHDSVPVRVRVFFAALFAYAMIGLVSGPLPPHATEPLGFVLAAAREALTGLTLGFVAQFIFWSVQFAGELIGFQMGLSLAQVYDPMTDAPSNPLGRLMTLLMLLLFFLADAHHYVVQAVVGSFRVVPLAGADFSGAGPLMLGWAGEMFVTALRLALPFIVVTLLTDVALGIFARVVPQVDLFALSVPLKLLLGLGIGFFFLKVLVVVSPELFSDMLRNLMRTIEALAPAG